MQLTPTYEFDWNLHYNNLFPKFRYKDNQYGLYGALCKFSGNLDVPNTIRLTKEHNKSGK